MKKWLYLVLTTKERLYSQIEIEPVGSYGLKKVGKKTYVSNSMVVDKLL